MSEFVREQAPPRQADGPDVWKLVMADMEARRLGGIAKHGVPVRPGNGRRPLVDAYQELLDLCVYLRQEIEERERAQGSPARAAESNVALQARVYELCAENDALLEARDKLQAFKDWVHQYLDAQGVPHHPPGTHGAEGCRIGDRMDWLMAKLRTAESCTATLQEERSRLHLRTLDLREQLGKAERERDALRVDLALARGKIVDLEGLRARVADLEHRLAQQTTTDTLVPEGSEP